jgi:hypothetical protein
MGCGVLGCCKKCNPIFRKVLLGRGSEGDEDERGRSRNTGQENYL